MTTVKTPELSAAMSAVMRVIDDADKGVADASQAKLVIGASNTACRIVKSDIDRRTSGIKLAALEAKQIEQGAQKQVGVAA
jgi:hypothetical protein